MRRALTISVAVLGFSAPAAGAQATTPLQASLTSCSAVTRTAVFTGSMSAVRGTRSMAMRFDLQARGVGGYSAVKVPGLGVYKRSSPGQTGFVFTQRVQELGAPGVYRAVVGFRWYGRDDRLLKRATRTTGTCVQPDPRPDLRPGVLAATVLGDGKSARYQLVVTNAGRADAGPFAVQIAGARVPVTGLAGAGGTITVTVDAPRCAPGDPVDVVVDPAAQVDEAVESDNSVQRPCPLS